MTMIWIPLQFPVGSCKTQMLEGVWDDGSASGNCGTLVSGLRSMALVAWRSLKIEKPHCDASEAADTCQEWWFLIPPLKSWVALTLCLKQREPVRFFLTSGLSLRRQITYAPLGLDTYNIVDAILSTVWIRKIKSISTVGRIIGKEAETVKVIPMSAVL